MNPVNTVWYFQTLYRANRQRKREIWWAVIPEDERTFSLGVLQRWRRVLPQLCCSCLNSIQNLKRKTQARWLLTQQALALVNNSSSPAHIVMLFTLRINKLLLWVCVCCEMKGGPQPFTKIHKAGCGYSLSEMYIYAVCLLTEKKPILKFLEC